MDRVHGLRAAVRHVVPDVRAVRAELEPGQKVVPGRIKPEVEELVEKHTEAGGLAGALADLDLVGALVEFAQQPARS